jgi:hypothetical protein
MKQVLQARLASSDVCSLLRSISLCSGGGCGGINLRRMGGGYKNCDFRWPFFSMVDATILYMDSAVAYFFLSAFTVPLPSLTLLEHTSSGVESVLHLAGCIILVQMHAPRNMKIKLGFFLCFRSDARQRYYRYKATCPYLKTLNLPDALRDVSHHMIATP